MRPLTLDQLEVISWLEKFWMTHGGFPSDEEFFDKFPSMSLQVLLKNETFALALKNRGISRIHSESGLTYEQVSAIALMLNFHDQRSQASKLKSLGIKTSTWNGWMKDVRFKNFYEQQSVETFQDSIDRVREGLLRSAEKGDTSAIKFYYEVTGRSNSQEHQNLKVILSRLVECIQRHVKDQATIEAIAMDFQAIMKNAPVETDAKVIEASMP